MTTENNTNVLTENEGNSVKKITAKDLKRKVSIRQYVDKSQFNLGLEKEGLSVFAGESGYGGHKEWLGYKEIGDTKVYLTGLDPEADSLDEIKDEDEREQRVEEILKLREYLKSKKKTSINADNHAFWKGVYIDIDKPVTELNLANINDLILYCGIKGGGFTEIAPSLTVAKHSNRTYKFYLHEDELAAEEKAVSKILKNKATVELVNMFEEDPIRMFYVSKLVLPIHLGFRRSTPPVTLYDKLDSYIQGEGHTRDIKKLPKFFLDKATLPLEEMKLRAVIREALHQSKIRKNAETGEYYNKETGVKYPNTEGRIFEYLMNPINSEELASITAQVSTFWNK